MRRTKTTKVLSSCAAALCIVFAAPAVGAQIPQGIDPSAISSMIPSQVTVRAGETTTVDIGVPVSVSQPGGGWNVISNGTTVSVTAPNTPGATTSVTASAAGYSATITLVAVGNDQSTSLEEQSQSGDGDTQDAEPSVVQTDRDQEEFRSQRQSAAPVDTASATRIDLDGEVHGSQLVVKVPLRQAADLAKYANTDREGAKLRYLDVNGRLIEGVKRDIDIPSRTLTLTYPEGQTPDNPFIIEVVRNDAAAEFIAVITATNVEQEHAINTESVNPYGEIADQSNAENQGKNLDNSGIDAADVALSIAGLAVAGAVVLGVILAVRQSRGRK